MIHSTVDGKPYVLVQALDNGDEYDNCCGCAFTDEDTHGCNLAAEKMKVTVACYGPLMFVEDSPEAIAEYMARRLS